MVNIYKTQCNVLKRLPLLLRGWWRRAATRMTLAFAARGALAMLIPFVSLLLFGQPVGGVFASLGGMFAVLSDTGGNYRRRLGAMVSLLLVGSACLYLGLNVAAVAWLLAPLLAVIAFATGMARAYGGSSIAIGLFASIMFLVGALTPMQVPSPAPFVGYFALGSLWVIGVHLALWRLRPYRVLLQEIAACYDACARLVTALEWAAAGSQSAVDRQRIQALHQSARETIRDAEQTLESVRVGAGHASPVFDRALLLLAAVSREVIAATGLRNMQWPQPGSEAARAWRVLFASWKRALVGVSRLLLTGRGEVSTAAMHVAFNALMTQQAMTPSQSAPLRLALLHLDAVAEPDVSLKQLKMNWRDALPRWQPGGLGNVWSTLAAHLSLQSIVFRHALRIAVAAGGGLWLSGVIGAPHRLWLPMTTMLVLQPEFGATWRRMGQRVLGTLVGVLIAGGLHFWVHGSVTEVVVIGLFAFASFYFVRTSYGLGVVMLTPMVLLLLGVLVPEASGMLIFARGLDTVLGGLLALAAAYVLWPLWERDTFLPQCATAVRAQRDHLAEVFDQPGDEQPSRPELMHARHAVERANDHADATLRRMIAEPHEDPGDTRAALNLVTYLRRLADNATHFSVVLRGARLTPEQRAQGDIILQRLDHIADALQGTTHSQALATITPRLGEGAPAGAERAPWFERFAADSAMLAIETRKLVPREARR